MVNDEPEIFLKETVLA